MKPATLACSALLFSMLFACAVESDDPTCIGERKIATNKLATNKLATNKIATNKLAVNGLLTEALPDAPLTSVGIADTVPSDALADEFVQSVLEYMVQCALTSEQSIEVDVAGERRVYAGAIGLAPAWGEDDGACDGACQSWVSACLIARTNAEGESRPISLLGDRPELSPTQDESATFTVEEATYFGDLFGDDRAMYACVPAGSGAPERTCEGDAGGCAITIVGDCDDACTSAGCRDGNGALHEGAITVNLPDDASCG